MSLESERCTVEGVHSSDETIDLSGQDIKLPALGNDDDPGILESRWHHTGECHTQAPLAGWSVLLQVMKPHAPPASCSRWKSRQLCVMSVRSVIAAYHS